MATKLSDPKLALALDPKLVQTDRIAPFASLHLARRDVANEFNHHGKRIRKGSQRAHDALRRYREKLGAIRRLSLELASLEIELKREIAFDQGIEVEGVGVLYWSSTEAGGQPHKARVNWMRLCDDRGISEDEIKRYKKDDSGERRFFLRRRVHTVEGIDHLGGAPKEDVGLDDEF